jgi:hypothetical protein
MGLFCGLIATGILAIAGQALPFSGVIGMYSRFPVNDRTGRFQDPRRQQQEDTVSFDVVSSDALTPDQAQHVWLHQDDLVVALVNKVTDGGSLAGDQPFAAIHPDYLDELYGQRIGIQVGTKHTMLSTSAKPFVDVSAVFSQPSFGQVDGEDPGIRSADKPVPSVLTPDPQHTLIVLRTTISADKNSADTDNIFRFSPGSVRLVCGHQSDQGSVYQDYHPIATLDPKRRIAVVCAPDDSLFFDSGDHTVDLVFSVDDDLAISGDPKSPQLAAGSFLEIKRYAIVDLSNKPIDKVNFPPNPDTLGIYRKPSVVLDIGKAKEIALAIGGGATIAEAAASSVAPGEAAGLTFKAPLTIATKLPYPIDPKSTDPAATVDLPTGVKGDFAARKWTHLSVTPTATIKDLAGASPDADIADLAIPDGQSMVVVHCSGPTSGDVWAWATQDQLSKFTLIDTGGHPYKIIGAWAKVRHTTDTLTAVSFAPDAAGAIPPIQAQASQGRPADVYFGFFVPSGTTINELRYGKSAMASDLGFAVN